RTFSDAVQRRRRLTDVIISTRSAGLVIDTVVCHLPSGRPGPVGSGAVSSRSPNSADRGQTFKRLAHYLICIKSDLVPWVWRACHYSAIFLIRPFLRPLYNRLGKPKSRAVRFGLSSVFLNRLNIRSK